MNFHDRARRQSARLLMMLCVLPGAAGLALALAGVSPDTDAKAFLIDWWWGLLGTGVFLALLVARILRR